MQQFEGKVVFITGGTSGIGEEIALQFAKHGAAVAFTGRRQEEGKKVEEKLKAAGSAGALFIQSSVDDGAAVEKAVQAAVSKFKRIDIAVNNAGIEEPMTPFLDQKVEKFDQIIGTNVRGMWFSLQSEIRQMIKQGTEGSIVNVSSVAGQLGFAHTSTYVASKHAVNGLTKSLASEFAQQKIRINAVAPGPIKTEMWTRFAESTPGIEDMIKQLVPMGKVGTCEEVASCVLWLASPANSYVTGQIVAVDGGMVNG